MIHQIYLDLETSLQQLPKNQRAEMNCKCNNSIIYNIAENYPNNIDNNKMGSKLAVNIAKQLFCSDQNATKARRILGIGTDTFNS